MENIYGKLMGLLSEGKKARMVTRVQMNGSGEGKADKQIFEAPQDALESKDVVWKDGCLTEYFYPEERLIILGGGHVALALSDFGARAGFAVTVVDDRPSFANNVRFASARQVICDDFIRAIDQLKITPSDYVVVLTRGHRFDKECLRTVLGGNFPAYIGMMGSKRRSKGMGQLLVEEGFDEEKVAAIHMPIGLSIGALLPEEIAISILAEIICEKRKKRGKDHEAGDVDFRVLEQLAKEEGSHAVVTVLSTKGPTPRRCGARMIVWPEGRIAGSIGGGCAEAAVMREALKYIGTGRCAVRTVDMTKDVSEDDVMVCGGVMEVLIEG